MDHFKRSGLDYLRKQDMGLLYGCPGGNFFIKTLALYFWTPKLHQVDARDRTHSRYELQSCRRIRDNCINLHSLTYDTSTHDFPLPLKPRALMKAPLPLLWKPRSSQTFLNRSLPVRVRARHHRSCGPRSPKPDYDHAELLRA